jgi:S1-C subfamily serine protease
MLAMGITVALAASRPLAGGSVTPRTETPGEARVISRAFAQVARAIGPSVVRIEVESADEEATASGVVIDTLGNVVPGSGFIEASSDLQFARAVCLALPELKWQPVAVNGQKAVAGLVHVPFTFEVK